LNNPAAGQKPQRKSGPQDRTATGVAVTGQRAPVFGIQIATRSQKEEKRGVLL
jgi:hypothetical protein